MLVVVEGIDGAGKTVVCRMVTDNLRRKGLRARLLDKNSLQLTGSFEADQMSRLRSTIWPEVREPEVDGLGTHFYLFLHASWWSGLRSLYDTSARSGGVLVCDGSFFRVMAKAHVRSGLALPWLSSLFSTALQPDLVILLDIQPELAWRRRSSFRNSEIGRWDGHRGDDRSSFCIYQNSIRRVLLKFADEKSWVSLNQTEDTTVHEMAEKIEKRIFARSNEEPWQSADRSNSLQAT